MDPKKNLLWACRNILNNQHFICIMMVGLNYRSCSRLVDRLIMQNPGTLKHQSLIKKVSLSHVFFHKDLSSVCPVIAQGIYTIKEDTTILNDDDSYGIEFLTRFPFFSKSKISQSLFKPSLVNLQKK